MKPDDARRIDENITAKLSRVAARVLRQPTARELFHVRDPRPAAPDVPHASTLHAVTAVQHPIPIDKNGPGDLRVRHVRARERCRFERDHADSYPEFLELLLVLLQLQQVPAAGESPKVPVKDQQEPVSAIVAKPVDAPFSVR